MFSYISSTKSYVLAPPLEFSSSILSAAVAGSKLINLSSALNLPSVYAFSPPSLPCTAKKSSFANPIIQYLLIDM